MVRIHVYPVNDTREHDTETPFCWCSPRIEQEADEEPRCIHNSADGREFFDDDRVDVEGVS